MAYAVETGVWSTAGIYASYTVAWMVQLRDFMVARGWDLTENNLDDTNPSVTLHSTGESGTEDFYIQLIKETANFVSVYSVRYWVTGAAKDASLLIMRMPLTVEHSIQFADAANVQYWIYGDKDKILVITRPTAAATYYFAYLGLITSAWTRFYTTTVQPHVIGDTVLHVDDASSFVVGQRYEIASLNATAGNTGGSGSVAGNFEQVVVVAKDTNSSDHNITISPGLVNNQASGARIGLDIRPIITTLASGATGHMVNAAGQNTTASGLIGYQTSSTLVPPQGGDPDYRQRYFWLFPLLVTGVVATAPEYRGYLTDVYCLSGSPGTGLPQILTEDTITVGATVYKAFNTNNASWIAIRVP